MKIFIDAGHNHSGGDTGAAGNGLKEQDVTYKIAAELSRLLCDAGHSVKMSRNDITENLGKTLSESLYLRCKKANDWGAELFVSIHCNAGGGVGTETYAYKSGTAADAYAKRVQSCIVKALGMVNRGVKYSGFYVLKYTAMPAILVETAFIDNAYDASLLSVRWADFAKAIFQGITGDAKETEKETQKEAKRVAQTVMKLPEAVYIQEMTDFEIVACDCEKRSIIKDSYFNAGFFAAEADGKTVPVGNLATDGVILAQAKDNPTWVNLAGKKLTTVFVTRDGISGIVQTDDLSQIEGLKTAVSGIPIILGGKYVPMEQIKSEGYFGDECYNTWHGFLGLRQGKLVYVAMQCGFESMCWALVALGIYDAVKLDGGGSFILKDGAELSGTSENRRIHNVGIWGRED